MTNAALPASTTNALGQAESTGYTPQPKTDRAASTEVRWAGGVVGRGGVLKDAANQQERGER